MIIVITSENSVPSEAQKINQLFEAGLGCLHLRKPEWSIDQHINLLNEIDSKSHDKIVTHHYHELINTYNLKGIHFTEQKRKDHIDNPGRYFKDLEMYGKTISSSFHSTNEISECYFEFDYYFLSPVFTSISKDNYEGKGFDVNNINERIIALGGISASNINETYRLGYKGVAVLGSIWNSKNELNNFKILNTKNKELLT